jgi:hypothetical protein
MDTNIMSPKPTPPKPTPPSPPPPPKPKQGFTDWFTVQLQSQQPSTIITVDFMRKVMADWQTYEKSI